jgi:PAT family beta-lactamase induction signal transducer AmpG
MPAAPAASPTSPDAGAPARSPSLLARIAAAPWVWSTYFAEGFPFSIVRQMSGELFTSMGASTQAIGATSLYGLAWNLKLFWSPILDRYGTLRRWLCAVQALLGIAVMFVAWKAGAQDLGGVAKALVVVAFLAATHDIAIDGFYLDALDKSGQAAFSGMRIAAYRVALGAGKALVAVSGLLQLAGWDKAAAWRAVFAAAGAGLLLMALAHTALLPRPPASAKKEGEDLATRYAEAIASYFTQPRILVSLAFIVLYKAGDAMLFAMNAPFLKDLGFGDALRGSLGTVAVVGSMTTSIVAGAVIARYGLQRTLLPCALIQTLAIPAYVALAITRPSAPVVAAVAVLEQVAGAVGDAGLAVFLMRRCMKEHKAAHYAIGSALMSVAATAAGVTSGFLVKGFGFPVFFSIAFVASLPGVLLAVVVPKE